MDQKTLINSA